MNNFTISANNNIASDFSLATNMPVTETPIQSQEQSKQPSIYGEVPKVNFQNAND